ncbi:MAG: hypothetical protein LBC92_02030 [Rickettsiales bacterium]|jgi:KDO2-lipid IV(A) lauroyltransferase|nr:hypothetical protein [Rickettsiales bacterium]
MRDYIYKSQAFFIKFFEKIILLTNLEISSAVFGLLFVVISPFIPKTYLAYKNITLAMPKKNIFEKIKIIIGVWNNIGRMVCEFIWFNSDKVDIKKYINVDEKSMKILEKIKKSKKGDVVFSAHFGNFEIFLQVANMFDLPKFCDIYRPLNNKYINKILMNYRNNVSKNALFIKKGGNGTRLLMKHLKSGGKALLFVDQRFNGGIISPFFNIPCATSATPSTLSVKHNYNLYSGMIIRRGFFSSKFDVVINNFKIKKTDDSKEDIYLATLNINKFFEKYIKKYPDQWFSWLHNRWKS